MIDYSREDHGTILRRGRITFRLIDNLASAKLVAFNHLPLLSGSGPADYETPNCQPWRSSSALALSPLYCGHDDYTIGVKRMHAQVQAEETQVPCASELR